MNVRRFLFLLFAALMLAPPGLVAASNSGSITSSQCVPIDASGLSTVGIQVTGTWSGTLQPQVSIQGQAAVNTQVTPTGSSSGQSTITANGLFTISVAGVTNFYLCGNTVASGTAVVYLNGSALSAKWGGSFPLFAPAGSLSAASYSFAGFPNYGLNLDTGNFALLFDVTGINVAAIDGNGLEIRGNVCYAWTAGTVFASRDTNLCRTGAGAVAIGNGTPGDATATLSLGSVQASSTGYGLNGPGASQGMSGSGGTTLVRGAIVRLGIPAGNAVDITGQVITNYNGVATTGAGVPSEVGIATSGTSSAAIAATNLLAAPVAATLYRVTAYLKITVVTAAPVAGAITLTYKDSDGVAQSVVMALYNAAGAVATQTGSTTTTPVSGNALLYCGAGTAIQYAIAFSGSGTYEYILKSEAL